MIYTINIVTITKSTDLYDAVALNKFPLLIVCGGDEFEQFLSSNEMLEFCKQYIKTKNLYDHAKFYIRTIDNENDDTVDSIVKTVSDYIQINY